jgi:hypothetical protein
MADASCRAQGGHGAARDHRRRNDPVRPRRRANAAVAQKGADLVAGQQPPPLPFAHGDPEAVGIGVVREHDVDSRSVRRGHRPVEGPRLLGVGEREIGEGAVGAVLLRDRDRWREPRRRECQLDGLGAHPAQWRVHDGGGGRPAQPGGDRGTEILGDRGTRGHQVEGLAWREVVLGRQVHEVHAIFDAPVDRGADLCSVGPVDLVAVVAPGIVAGRDHHRGPGGLVKGEGCDDGRGYRAVHQDAGNAQPAEGASGVGRVGVGVRSGIVTHDHPALCEPGRDQLRAQGPGGDPHDHPVHSPGARSHRTTQPCGAEAQRDRRIGWRPAGGP